MTSSALILPRPQNQETALLLRQGPGLTVFQFVNSCAVSIDSVLNATFRGPKGPKAKIDDFFSEDQARERVLDELYKADRVNLTKLHKKLQGYCRDLLKYANPKSHTVDTQLVTFKIIVAVVTRYPGIRRLFYQPECSEQVLSTFKENWTRLHQDCGGRWTFYRDYTLHCLSDSEPTALVEKELPSELGRLELSEDNWDKMPIENLLSLCSSIPEFNYTKLSAIRYLAGILELPTFWEKGSNVQQRFSDVLIALCRTIFELIQDTKSEADEDVDLNGDSPLWLSAARNAADILASATFDGLLRLHRLDRIISPHPPQLPNIVSLLQQSEMKIAFPKASDRASQVNEILKGAEIEPESTDLANSSNDTSSPSFKQERPSALSVKRNVCCLLTPKLCDLFGSGMDSAVKITSICFKIVSHDQGWCNQNNFSRPYEGSYTWFEAVVVRDFIYKQPATGSIDARIRNALSIRGNSTNGEVVTVKTPNDENSDVWIIQRNKRASREYKLHTVLWKEAHDGTDESVLMNETGRSLGRGFVRSLKMDDRIAVMARAQYLTWFNYIRSVDLEISYSVGSKSFIKRVAGSGVNIRVPSRRQ
ncbi:hypothetical protein BYT27DRAFT_7148106 [Phlegmacium glaucopus]|nr:hypothetical protein BYT27DRAFT_7148106 [Phlegmacium glaucopus]